MAAQDHLSNDQFALHTAGKRAYKIERGPGYREVTATPVGGARPVGFINWHDPDPKYPQIRDTSIIHRVQVNKAHQRRGLATAMFNMARTIQPDLHHSHALTPDGKAWSQSTP